MNTNLFFFKKKNNGLQRRQVRCWFVGKAVFFFKYSFGTFTSFYVFAEVMKEHGAAAHDINIPTVVPFPAGQTKKYVVFDAADIISVVGLVSSFQQVRHSHNRVTVKQARSYQVIRPFTVFNKNMKSWAGKISNL